MTAKLIQGPAEPVYLVDRAGNEIDRTTPLYVRIAPADLPLQVQLEPVDAELENSIEGTITTAGDNLVGPTPDADERLCITAFSLQNESATASVCILKDGVAPAAGRWRVRGQLQGDGLAMVFDGQHPLRLSAGNRIVLNLSAAVLWNYSIQFYREAV